MNTRGRQFSRGGMAGPGPSRRRKFHGQYVRRRTNSGGYRAGSFSDDRNDSSPPPPNSANRHLLDQNNDLSYAPHPQPQYQPPRRLQRPQARPPRQGYHSRNSNNNNPNDRHPYDSHYQRGPNQHHQPSRDGYDASDNEFQDHASRQPSRDAPADGPLSSSRKLEELTKSYHDQRTDLDEMRTMFTRLCTELDQVKGRVKELESSCPMKSSAPVGNSDALVRESGDWNDQNEREKRKKSKAKQREKRAAKLAEKRAAISGQTSQLDGQQPILNQETAVVSTSDKPTQSTANQNVDPSNNNLVQPLGTSKYNARTTRERNADRRKPRRELKEKPTKILSKIKRNSVNDDSTTQAADPSSEDRNEGDEGPEDDGKERTRVLRRKKPFGRRGAYGNRRRRADSSERHSNDTSPQGECEANAVDEFKARPKKTNVRRNYPDLSSTEMTDIIDSLKSDFLNGHKSIKAIKELMNEKGPKVVCEFAISVLDHAMCNVTSPTKLSDIANNLAQLLVSEDNTCEVDFQQGFYDALNDISKREEDLLIDAPRYMDTLGQVLAECVVQMSPRYKYLIKKFLNKSINAYCEQNRSVLLASIMKSIAGIKDERFAKDVWDTAHLNWSSILSEDTDLDKFLESHDIKFTTRTFSPEPPPQKKGPKELERFADDVTDLVEQKCQPETLENLVRDLNLEPTDEVEYLSTLIYAIVRGCVAMNTEEYKLNNEALNLYSSILTAKRKEQETIAVQALTALTKLWHQYNCPQDLMRTVLVALHNVGTVSYEALNTWLNSESLNNIPGIGAARLSSKRYIEDLGASLKVA